LTTRYIWPSIGRKLSSFVLKRRHKVVFGSGDGRLYVLSLDDGSELWSYEIGRSLFSSPAVADGVILIGSNDGSLYAFGDPARVAVAP